MPLVERRGAPALYYELDDYTDPWRNAPYIVLQHGFARSSKFWYQWVPYLSRFYKVIRTDLRGLGRSSKAFDLTTGFTAANWVGDVEAILDHAGADSVHYCGESFGGILGMVLAATQPARKVPTWTLGRNTGTSAIRCKARTRRRKATTAAR